MLNNTPEPDIAALRAEVAEWQKDEHWYQLFCDAREQMVAIKADLARVTADVASYQQTLREEYDKREGLDAELSLTRAGYDEYYSINQSLQNEIARQRAEWETVLETAERQRDEAVEALKRISKLSQDETDPQQTIREDSSSGNYYDDVWAGARLAYYECADIARATLTKLQSSREEGGEG